MQDAPSLKSRKFIYLKLFYYSMCIGALIAHMPVHHMNAVPTESRIGIKSLETRVTADFEVLCG